jgi:hypothetical protein
MVSSFFSRSERQGMIHVNILSISVLLSKLLCVSPGIAMTNPIHLIHSFIQSTRAIAVRFGTGPDRLVTETSFIVIAFTFVISHRDGREGAVPVNVSRISDVIVRIFADLGV